jgi:hypothetical protein
MMSLIQDSHDNYYYYYYYDSGGLSSGQPWMQLIMLLVQWQLIPFWIMRSSRGFISFWCLFHHLTLLYCYYTNFLWVFLLFYTDCQILQERTIWSWQVWQIFKTWVNMWIISWENFHRGVGMHYNMFLSSSNWPFGVKFVVTFLRQPALFSYIW